MEGVGVVDTSGGQVERRKEYRLDGTRYRGKKPNRTLDVSPFKKNVFKNVFKMFYEKESYHVWTVPKSGFFGL